MVKKSVCANRDFRSLDQAGKKGQKPGDDVAKYFLVSSDARVHSPHGEVCSMATLGNRFF